MSVRPLSFESQDWFENINVQLYTWVERGTASKLFCPRTQHLDLGQGSNTKLKKSGIQHTTHSVIAPLT